MPPEKGTSLDELKETESVQVPLDEVPLEFDGTIVSSEIKADSRDNDCLFIRVSIEGDAERVFTQKYTPTAITDFREAIEKMGFKVVPLNRMFHWRKQKTGRSVFERWIPTGIVAETGKE